MRNFAATSDGCSGLGDRRDEVKISVRLFMLPLRAHAESMPRNDPEIEAWALQLLSIEDGDRSVLAFADWVLDWSSKERCSEFICNRIHLGRGEMGKLIRSPLFPQGGVSLSRREEGMARRFEEIAGGKVMLFATELGGK